MTMVLQTFPSRQVREVMQQAGFVNRVHRGIDRRKETPIALPGARVIDAPGYDGRRGWYVLACRVWHEGDMARRLHEAGFEYFLPMEKQTFLIGRGARKIKRTVDRAFFPGYIFVFCELTAAAFNRLAGLRGSGGVVTTEAGVAPAPVPPAVMAEIMGIPVRLPAVEKPLGVGDAVEIADSNSPFFGLVGKLAALDNHGRIGVVLGILGSTIPVKVSMAGVERAVEG